MTTGANAPFVRGVHSPSVDFPAFLRSAFLRIVAGSMLLGGIFAMLAALVTTHTSYQLSCALAAGVCFVAAYHYAKLVDIRAQTGMLAAAGAVPSGQATTLNLSCQDMASDAVRYSDWIVRATPRMILVPRASDPRLPPQVTLPVLAVDMHVIMEPSTAPWFGAPWSALLILAMLLLGAYTRFATDELVPPRNAQKDSYADSFARVSGLVAFLVAFCLLAIFFCNLYANLGNDPTNGWIYAFTIPWAFYGLVALVAILVRQAPSDEYPEPLSVFKDVAFGVLDVWSKSVFAGWLAAHALDKGDLLFTF